MSNKLQELIGLALLINLLAFPVYLAMTLIYPSVLDVRMSVTTTTIPVEHYHVPKNDKNSGGGYHQGELF